MSDVFRRCASAVVVRPSSVLSDMEVLLVHKPRKKDAWQLPQGGIEEGETIEQAAVRELHEEAGIVARAVRVSDKTYQYEFPASYRRFRPDSVCGQIIHFIYAELQPPEQTVTVDNNEIDDYVWAPVAHIGDYITRQEYKQLIEQLIAEFTVA